MGLQGSRNNRYYLKKEFFIVLTQSQKEQIFYLCKDNETLRDIFSQFCHSIDEDLGHLNQMVRNELSALSASVQMLIQKNPSLMEQRQWSIIEENYSNLYRLMTIYENYRNNFHTKSTYIDVVDLCEKISSQFQTLASERNIDFLYENHMTNPQILRHYFGDSEKIEDSIIGLLKHAFHTIPGVTYVKISLHNIDTTKAIIHVEWNGTMITEKDLQDLKQAQISKSLYAKYNGIITAKQFADICEFDFSISSSEEKTYVDFGIPTTEKIDF